MPKSDFREGYFCPTLTLMIDMIDSYIHGQPVRETEILAWVRKICPQDHHSSSVSLATYAICPTSETNLFIQCYRRELQIYELALMLAYTVFNPLMPKFCIKWFVKLSS